jgi:hypothetical protein
MAMYSRSRKYWVCECGSSKWEAKVYGTIVVSPSPDGEVSIGSKVVGSLDGLDLDNGPNGTTNAVACGACGEDFEAEGNEPESVHDFDMVAYGHDEVLDYLEEKGETLWDK